MPKDNENKEDKNWYLVENMPSEGVWKGDNFYGGGKYSTKWRRCWKVMMDYV